MAVIVIWHIRQTRQWWKERQDTKYKNCLLRTWNRWQYEIYYWRRFSFGIVTKSRNSTSRKWNLMKRYKKHLQVRTGGAFDELEVKDFYEKDLQKCKRQGSHKTRSSLTIPVRCIKRKFWEDMQNNGLNLKTFFISGSSGLGKSFAKDL